MLLSVYVKALLIEWWHHSQSNNGHVPSAIRRELRDKYTRFLGPLRQTLLDVCVNRLQRNNINEAIKAYSLHQQLRLNNSLNNRGNIFNFIANVAASVGFEPSIAYIVDRAYRNHTSYDPSRIPAIIGFGQRLPNVNHRALVFIHIGTLMLRNRHHVHPYNDIFVLANLMNADDLSHASPGIIIRLNDLKLRLPAVVRQFSNARNGIYLHSSCLLDAGPRVHQRDYSGRLPHRDNPSPWNPYLLFYIIAIEMGAYFLLHNRRSNVFIDGGPRHQFTGGIEAARNNQWTHWRVTVNPHSDQSVLLQSRTGNHPYLTATPNRANLHTTVLDRPLNQGAAQWRVLDTLSELTGRDFTPEPEPHFYAGRNMM